MSQLLADLCCFADCVLFSRVGSLERPCCDLGQEPVDPRPYGLVTILGGTYIDRVSQLSSDVLTVSNRSGIRFVGHFGSDVFI